MREKTAEEVRGVPNRPRDEEGQRKPFYRRVSEVGEELRELRPEPGDDGEVAQHGREQLPVEYEHPESACLVGNADCCAVGRRADCAGGLRDEERAGGRGNRVRYRFPLNQRDSRRGTEEKLEKGDLRFCSPGIPSPSLVASQRAQKVSRVTNDDFALAHPTLGHARVAILDCVSHAK